MADLFSIGTSALLTTQKALGATGHNVANVNTPGYSRQRVDVSTRQPAFTGAGFIGNGVQADSISRSYNGFVVDQARISQSAFHRQQTYMELAQQVDNLLGDTETSLASSLQDFFNSVQGVADAPTSAAARQVMLSEGGNLVSRFRQLSQGLQGVGDRIDGQIQTTVDEINNLASAVAGLNDDIAKAFSQSGGQTPNDLLDQRDALLDELSQRVAVSVVPTDNSVVNVFIGSGYQLVLENQASTLNAASAGQDKTRLDITAVNSNGSVSITNQIKGGQLSGLLEVRDEVLLASQNALGQIGIGLAAVFNQQHHQGMDLNGLTGQDFFTVPQPHVIPDSANGGPGPVLVGLDDAGQLTTDDYQLSFDGAAWTLSRVSDGQPVPLVSGAGTVADPYRVNGLSMVLDPEAVAGDRYLIQPVRKGAGNLEVALVDNTQIAAAGALATKAVNTNTGNAQISAAQVLDPTDPNLLSSVTLSFDDPPTSYRINDAASIPYTSGDSIKSNGWQIQITGDPQAGDSFSVGGNQGAVGDNHNALQLAGLQQTLILGNRTASFGDAYGSLLADVGTKTHRAQVSASALEQRLEQAQADRESISGVNLDEEAAALVRFQQAYQAAAQVIAVADLLFESLLGAVRR